MTYSVIRTPIIILLTTTALALGACVGGPCAGGKLTPWPVEARGGIIRTA